MGMFLRFLTCAVGLMVLPGWLSEEVEAFRASRVVPAPTPGLVQPTGATPDCVRMGVQWDHGTENSLPPTFAL